MWAICCEVHGANVNTTGYEYSPSTRRGVTKTCYQEREPECTDYRYGLAIIRRIESFTTICEKGQEMAPTSQAWSLDEEGTKTTLQACTRSEDRRADPTLETDVGCSQTKGILCTYKLSDIIKFNPFLAARTGQRDFKSLYERKVIQADGIHVVRKSNLRERMLALRYSMPNIFEESYHNPTIIQNIHDWFTPENSNTGT